jgi:hypothetical protein
MDHSRNRTPLKIRLKITEASMTWATNFLVNSKKFSDRDNRISYT